MPNLKQPYNSGWNESWKIDYVHLQLIELKEAFVNLISAINENTRQMAEFISKTSGYTANIVEEGNVDSSDDDRDEEPSQEIPSPN